MTESKPTCNYETNNIVIPFPSLLQANRCKEELDILATVEGYITVADLYSFSYPGRWKCLYEEWHFGWSKETILNADIKSLKNPDAGTLYFIDLPIAKRISTL